MKELNELVEKSLLLKGDSLEQLQDVIVSLFAEQFILRRDFERYEFIRRNEDIIRGILNLCGLRLEHNSDYLFYYVATNNSKNRVSLNQAETIVLLIIRLLYEEMMYDLKVINGVASLTNSDIQDKYRAFINADRPMDKTQFRNAMTTLKRFNIIEYDGAFSLDAEFKIRILPTILSVIDRTTIESLISRLDDFSNKESKEADA